MSKLLYIELLKLSNKNNWALLIIFLIFNTLLVSILLTSSFIVTGGIDTISNSTISYLYRTYIDKISFFQSMFIAILMIINAGNEYRYGVVKKTLADGYTRSEFLRGKIGITVIIATLLTALSISEFIVVGCNVSDNSFIDVLNVVSAASVIRLWVYLFSFGISGMFLSHIFKAGNLSLITFLGWLFAEKLLILIDDNKFHLGLSDWAPLNVFAQVTDLTSVLTAFDIAQVVIYLLTISGLYFYLFSKNDF